jgi:transcription antitermination factor NusG
VTLHGIVQGAACRLSLLPSIPSVACDRNWYAVFTYPRHETSTAKQLEMREIEFILPTYEKVRVWKNRQRMKIVLPLFPTYLFVHINSSQRTSVLKSPGVLQIVGTGRESVALYESEIALLRNGFNMQKFEPFSELLVGTKVRIKAEVMQDVKGTLVRQCANMRFVLTVKLINQHAAIQK